MVAVGGGGGVCVGRNRLMLRLSGSEMVIVSLLNGLVRLSEMNVCPFFFLGFSGFGFDGDEDEENGWRCSF